MSERRSIAIYPGTFDPITNGHADIVRRALKLFDQVVVALADNLRKQPLFSLKERKRMIHETLKDEARVEVDSFGGLLVDYVRRVHQIRDAAYAKKHGTTAQTQEKQP